MKPPAYAHFRVANWFAWIIEAHKVGYSDADILFVLTTVGILDEIRAALKRFAVAQEE